MPLKINYLELLRLIFFIPAAALAACSGIFLSTALLVLLKRLFPIFDSIPDLITSSIWFSLGGLAYFYAGIYTSPHSIKKENILVFLTIFIFLVVGHQGSFIMFSAKPSIGKLIQYSPGLIGCTLATLLAWGKIFKGSFHASLLTIKTKQLSKK